MIFSSSSTRWQHLQMFNTSGLLTGNVSVHVYRINHSKYLGGFFGSSTHRFNPPVDPWALTSDLLIDPGFFPLCVSDHPELPSAEEEWDR